MATIILISGLIACVPSLIIWWVWKIYVLKVIIIPNILRVLDSAWANADGTIKAMAISIDGSRSSINEFAKALSALEK